MCQYLRMSRCMVIKSDNSQVSGFCPVVNFNRGGSATNGAILYGLQYCNSFTGSCIDNSPDWVYSSRSWHVPPASAWSHLPYWGSWGQSTCKINYLWWKAYLRTLEDSSRTNLGPISKVNWRDKWGGSLYFFIFEKFSGGKESKPQ